MVQCGMVVYVQKASIGHDRKEVTVPGGSVTLHPFPSVPTAILVRSSVSTVICIDVYVLQALIHLHTKINTFWCV